MPTLQGTDLFSHNDFTVPGGGPYSAITGTPTMNTSIVHSGDPASLLISTSAAAEAVQYDFTGTGPAIAWVGFWWRVESGAEPVSDTTICQFAMSGAHAKLSYQGSQDRFYHFWDGGVAQANAASTYTPGTWVWIEVIAHASAATRVMYTRYGGTDIASPATLATTSTTVSNVWLGTATGSPTVVMRYSRAMWGTAANATDWLGEPVGQTLLPDADVVTTGWTTTPLFSKLNDSTDATVITATAA